MAAHHNTHERGADMAHTITNPSPYQISMAMRVTRDVARDMLSDDSGSTYTRDVFGELVTLDPVARTLTTHTPAPADDSTPAAATPARKGVVYRPAMAGDGEVATPGAEYALTMFGFRTIYSPDSRALANLAGIDRVSRLAPISAREVTRGSEWEMELVGAPAVPASGNAIAGLIAEWLTDPVYTGVVTDSETGYYRPRAGAENARYVRTGN